MAKRVLVARNTKIAEDVIKELTAVSATDKALILSYAFLMLCDSVSTKAEVVFGKQFTSHEVQLFFTQKAVEQLRRNGLIAEAPPLQ